MSTQKPKQKWRKISDLLIWLGGIIVLGVIVYYCATYPWATLFYRWGFTAPNFPADPDPLPVMNEPLPENFYTTLPSSQDVLPSQPDSPDSRPEIYLQSLGIIKIPALSLSENIVEGQDDELLYGVGHSPGTALPGQEGNCFLPGHRNYIRMRPFRYLDLLKVDDLVYLIDDENTYIYRVYDIFVVGPDDVWIMAPIEGESHALTLMTCTPVLNPVDRLVVRCRLINSSQKYQ